MEGRIVRVLHHILDALHLGAHLHQALSRRDQRPDRPAEAGQEPLKLGDHAHGELTVHGQPCPGDGDGAAAHHRYDGGDQTQYLFHPGRAHLLGVDAGLISGPASKEAVFRAAGFNRLNHLNAGDGGAGQLAPIPHLHPAQVDALLRNNTGHCHVDRDGDKPQQGQLPAVSNHHHKVKHHHDEL